MAQFPTPLPQTVFDYLLSILVPKFDKDNIVLSEPGDLVEMTGTSGTAIFNFTLQPNEESVGLIMNPAFKIGDKINPELKYDFNFGGNPCITNTLISVDGAAQINIRNIGDSDTAAPFIVLWQIT